ncbi:unnamed protein product [Acidithrix sp. C25]|nr:unnamed protein product [Acidithrix sp. C25]
MLGVPFELANWIVPTHLSESKLTHKTKPTYVYIDNLKQLASRTTESS